MPDERIYRKKDKSFFIFYKVAFKSISEHKSKATIESKAEDITK